MEGEEAAIEGADLDEVDAQGLRERMHDARVRAGGLLARFSSEGGQKEGTLMWHGTGRLSKIMDGRSLGHPRVVTAFRTVAFCRYRGT